MVVNGLTNDTPYTHILATTRSHLQLINTSIDIFLNKLHAFLKEKEEEGRPMMDKRKLDDTMGSRTTYLLVKCNCTYRVKNLEFKTYEFALIPTINHYCNE